jgi:hypothetical protein
MSNFLLAVGGTGQHVALALADYQVLAHSVSPSPLAPIHFILLDADPSGSAEKSAWALAEEQVRVLAELPDGGQGFPLPTWRPATPHQIKDGTLSAKNALDEVEARGTADLLFTPDQSAVEIRSGFHGEPRVAAALADVLIQELRADDKLMARDPIGPALNALNGANRICIAGSAIGGTGAGVLPRLISTMADWQGRQAQLCAVIGLPWFQLDGDEAAQERMRANACSCLYHYFRTQRQGSYRLVLWGHPDVATARREHDYGAKMQGVKTDLTLPIYAAAAAQAFFAAPQNHAELARESVLPVGDPHGVHLASALDFGDLTLGELLRRNAEIIQALGHAARWMREPWRPLAFVGWGAIVRAGGLEKLNAPERAERARQIEALIAAKERAMARLRASDPELQVPPPTPWGGIPALRNYFPADQQFTLALALGAVRPPAAAGTSQQFLVPNEVTRVGGLNESPPGARVKMEGAHKIALAPFIGVRVSRVPDVFGVDMVLADALDTDEYWDANGAGKRLEARLVGADGRFAVPPALGAVEGDTYVAWLSRWFILFGALLNGSVRIQELASPIRERITHQLMLDGATAGTPAEVPIGYLSPETVCVPAVVAFWKDARAVERLVAKVGRWRDVMAAWTRAVRQVGTCLDPRGMPPWLRRLEALAGEEARIGGAPARLDPHRRVPVRWPSANGNGPTFSVPLPAAEGGVGVRELCNAFGLAVTPLDGVQDHDLTNAERAAKAALTRVTVKVRAVTGDKEWERAATSQIVWIEELDLETRKLLHDDLLLAPGRARALELPVGARPLTLDEVFCEHLVLLNNGADAYERVIPVRAPYVSLVGQVSPREERTDGVEVVRLRLAGRAVDVTRHYHADKVIRMDRKKPLTLFTWPHRYPRGSGAHALLLMAAAEAADMEVQARVLFERRNQGEKSLELGSPWLNERDRFHHVEPAASGLTWGDPDILHQIHPSAIQLRAANVLGSREGRNLAGEAFRIGRQATDLGFLAYRAVHVTPGDHQEHWCIDLGTSSTVIARRTLHPGGASEAKLVWPRAAGDATSVYGLSEKIDRSYLAWFPTWQDMGAADVPQKIMPSQVILRKKLEEVRPDGPRYGQDFVLDHGLDVHEAFLKNVVDDLKWRTGALAAFRRPFIRHLIEQAVAIENQRAARNDAGALPVASQVDVTFTLPLRQRDDLPRFADEVKTVCNDLAASTGITFRPLFQWESQAIAPAIMHMRDDVMFVGADLGGGTLDLFAARYSDGAPVQQALESAHLGGGYCVDILFKRKAGNKKYDDVKTFRRAIRNGLTREEAKQMEADAPEVHEYFALVYRYIALWADALREAWGLSDNTETYLQLAGLGWSLPGAAGGQKATANELTHVAAGLKVPLRFLPWGEDPIISGAEGRKTFLAVNCAERQKGLSAADLQQNAGGFQMVLGLPVQSKGAIHSRTVGLQDVRGASTLDTAAALRLDQGLTPQALSDVNTRLSRAVIPHDLRWGALERKDGPVSISPLTCVAEEAVFRLVKRMGT